MQNLGIKSLRVNKTCNILLGLFSPYKFEMKEYKGYNITRFKDNIRFLEVLVNRDKHNYLYYVMILFKLMIFQDLRNL